MNSARFTLELAKKLCETARVSTARRIKSKTLRNALACRIDSTGVDTVARLAVPHYWAVYYHDGRGPIKPKNGKYLVWFKNIQDDPRVAGGSAYPVRATEVRKLNLSKKEFSRLARSGRLIISKKSKRTTAQPFFRPLRTFQNKASPIIKRDFSRFVTSSLAKAGLLHAERTILITIG